MSEKKTMTYVRSSADSENTQLENMLQSVKDGNVDCVVVKSRARLSDSPDECDSIIQKIEESGMKIIETDSDEVIGETK